MNWLSKHKKSPNLLFVFCSTFLSLFSLSTYGLVGDSEKSILVLALHAASTAATFVKSTNDTSTWFPFHIITMCVGRGRQCAVRKDATHYVHE
jgi:hypothetical protein